MLRTKHRTERIVAVGITVVVVRIEHTRIAAIIVIAPTFEERIARSRKVRVVQFNPYYFNLLPVF